MTLLVADNSQEQLWMIADAAVTGGSLHQGQNDFAIKIEPSLDGRALVGFAGDHHHGTRLIRHASKSAAGDDIIALLLDGHRQYPSVDFAYAYLDANNNRRLVRIANGQAKELPTLHLGLPEAFEHFQRIRHDLEIDPSPYALKSLFLASRAPERPLNGVSDAIASMLRLFAERGQRDIGGWATAYLLTKSGAFLCSYSFSVSDPIFDKITPGSIVPHGTAEAGGFGLSLTELGSAQGIIVYWLQLPGGLVYRRAETGYVVERFEGTPSTFIERASALIGIPVEIFFADTPSGQPEKLSILRDENGEVSAVIAFHGNSFSVSVLNTITPFRLSASLDMSDHSPSEPDHFKLTVSDDKRALTIEVVENGSQLKLAPDLLDELIRVLGELRATLDGVPAEPNRAAGHREVMIVDPAWRTEMPFHPSINGAILRLRHPGFGWLTFILPWHETRSLGEWLKGVTYP